MPRPSSWYKNKAGKRLCGATTPIGIIWEPYKAKNMLDWAVTKALNFEEGVLKPIYHEWDRDRKGLTGTITHAKCIDYVTGETTDITKERNSYFYCKEVEDRSDLLLGKFKTWYDSHPFSLVQWENQMVHEEFQYGGTPDMTTAITSTIKDIKTGFVDEFSCGLQLSAYSELNYHNFGYRCRGQIVGFDQKDNIKVVEYSQKELESMFPIFLKALDIYKFKQQYLKEKKNG